MNENTRRDSKKLSLGGFDFSRYALKRGVERNISELEIKEAGRKAKIIEDGGTVSASYVLRSVPFVLCSRIFVEGAAGRGVSWDV